MNEKDPLDAAQIEAEVNDPAAASGTDEKIFDDDADIEDLEFLIDDIEDQIAPLG
ncbi:hypothetical protein [Actinoplanes flavus]|uniref:Uncharacterized protein n=1 Tax=Actinoplanes flavus TaxID=2820290 RepID=A0ABS3UK78_9ACTN|nr:hypothetical protein [Actinoplanes flavus]MBO3738107.1 hypothetical protein [Actinoplanes flavus]